MALSIMYEMPQAQSMTCLGNTTLMALTITLSPYVKTVSSFCPSPALELFQNPIKEDSFS